MIKINWRRLLTCMLITGIVSIALEKYFGIHTSSAFIAGLGVLVGMVCIRWAPQRN